MKIVDDDGMKKFPDDTEVLWVCGSKMPSKDHPMFGGSMEDKCHYCRSTVVHNKSIPEGVTVLCLTCAHLCHKAYVDSGETPEVVMRAKDKKIFEEANKGTDLERLTSMAMDALVNGPKRRRA